MEAGRDALRLQDPRFIGVTSPDGPPSKVCLPTSPEERLPTMTIIKLNYIHSNEAKWRRPTVDSTTTHGTGPLPTFITTDATGRIMEPHDGLLHPTSSWISMQYEYSTVQYINTVH